MLAQSSSGPASASHWLWGLPEVLKHSASVLSSLRWTYYILLLIPLSSWLGQTQVNL